MLRKLKIHGYTRIIKIIDNKPHYIDVKKGKLYWQETVIEKEKLKKFKEIKEIDLLKMIMEIK